MSKLHLLQKAQLQLSIWDEVLSRTQSQLSSLSNLVEQLETVQRCISSKKLGVINQDPAVVHLLQGKLVKKMERILGEVNEERCAFLVTSIIYLSKLPLIFLQRFVTRGGAKAQEIC